MLERFEHFIINITEIDLYWHRIAGAVMSAYDLKGNYGIYFTKLNGCKEGYTSAELAAQTGKDKADVSRDTNLLIKKGLIKKTSAGGNTYRAKLSLTDTGKELAEKLSLKICEAVEQVGLDTTEESRNEFYLMMDEIKEKLKKLSESDFG